MDVAKGCARIIYIRVELESYVLQKVTVKSYRDKVVKWKSLSNLIIFYGKTI